MPTIHFYQGVYIDIKKIVKEGKKRAKIIERKVDFDIFEEEIKSIIINNINEEHCILLEENPNWRLMEIIGLGEFVKGKELYEYSEANLRKCDFVFGRLGRKKDISGVQRRDRETYSAQNIEKEEKEDIEIYTYFYIFFEKAQENKVMTIAYLSGQSAPGIRLLSNLVFRYGDKDSKRLNIQPIITQDIINVIKRKEIINSFTYKIAVPVDGILKGQLKLSEDDFDKFRNLNQAEIQITIAGKRNQDIFNDKNVLSDLVEKIPIYPKKKGKDITFKAKDSGEDLANYKYIDNKVVRKVEFEYQSTEKPEARQKEIKNKLYDMYMQNRKSLISFARE